MKRIFLGACLGVALDEAVRAALESAFVRVWRAALGGP